jgi:hypothetical protein
VGTGHGISSSGVWADSPKKGAGPLPPHASSTGLPGVYENPRNRCTDSIRTGVRKPPAPSGREEVAILKIGPHDPANDPYREVADELGVPVSTAPRTKPPCCDPAGDPPLDPQVVEQLEAARWRRPSARCLWRARSCCSLGLVRLLSDLDRLSVRRPDAFSPRAGAPERSCRVPGVLG